VGPLGVGSKVDVDTDVGIDFVGTDEAGGRVDVGEDTTVGDETGSTQQPITSVRESAPSTEMANLINGFVIICVYVL
jgi:hypothetical protein